MMMMMMMVVVVVVVVVITHAHTHTLTHAQTHTHTHTHTHCDTHTLTNQSVSCWKKGKLLSAGSKEGPGLLSESVRVLETCSMFSQHAGLSVDVRSVAGTRRRHT